MTDQQSGHGPRVTPADIEAEIIAETYFTAADGILGAYRNHDDVYQGTGQLHHDGFSAVTICALILRNGAKVVGVNYGPVVAAEFDAAKAHEYARADAIEQIWPLLGFRLRDQLAAGG